MTTPQTTFANKYDAVGNIVVPQIGNQSPASNSGIVYNPSQTPIAMGAISLIQTRKNIVFLAQDGGKVSIGTNLPPEPGIDGEASISIYDKVGNLVFNVNDGIENALMSLIAENYEALSISAAPGRGTGNGTAGLPLLQIIDSSADEDSALGINLDQFSDGITVNEASTGSGTPFVTAVSALASNVGTVAVSTGGLVTGTGTAFNPNMVGATFASGAFTGTISAYSSATSVTLISGPVSPIGAGATYTVTRHFTRQATFLQPNSLTKKASIWVSDGANPNGVLPGILGDLCLNGPSGVPYYCSTAGTGWTAL